MALRAALQTLGQRVLSHSSSSIACLEPLPAVQQLRTSLSALHQTSELHSHQHVCWGPAARHYSAIQALSAQASCSSSSWAMSEASTSGRSSDSSESAGSQRGITVRYPFAIEYLTDREAMVHSFKDFKPVKLQHLSGEVFNQPVRIDILHRVVRYLRAKWRQGTHKAKDRSEVSGGGRKPWPQKGTGRSRHGSIRSPLWKGGGAVHGPRPRSHAHDLPAKVQQLGFKCALSAKFNEGRLVIVDTLLPSSFRTKAVTDKLSALVADVPSSRKDVARELDEQLKAEAHLRAQEDPSSSAKFHYAQAFKAAPTQTKQMLNWPRATALLVDCGDRGADGGELLRKAAANLEDSVHVMSWKELTVYHILKYEALVLTQGAAEALSSRLLQAPVVTKPVRSSWWQQQKQGYDQALAELNGSS